MKRADWHEKAYEARKNHRLDNLKEMLKSNEYFYRCLKMLDMFVEMAEWVENYEQQVLQPEQSVISAMKGEARTCLERYERGEV